MLSAVKDGASARRDVLKTAKERGVRWIRLAFVDILGIEKNIIIPASQLERALGGHVTFDGGSIDGFVRGEEVDMILRPDPATFAILPWTREGSLEARIMCDIAMPDGTPFEGCPRTTLKRVLEDAGDVAIAGAGKITVQRAQNEFQSPPALGGETHWLDWAAASQRTPQPPSGENTLFE